MKYKFDIKSNFKKSTLAGVTKWLEDQPAHWRVVCSILSQEQEPELQVLSLGKD